MPASILEALVERLLGGVDHDAFADRSQPWRQRVEAVALELREQLAAHPGAVSLIVGGTLSGPHALALNERTREFFAEAGLDRADAVRASRVLLVYILGSLAVEIAHPDAEELELPSGGVRPATGSGVYPQAGRVPPDGAARDGHASHASTDLYLWGLHRLLDDLSRNILA